MKVLRRVIAAAGLAVALTPAIAAIPAGYAVVARSESVPADILYAVACAEAGRPMPDGGLALAIPRSRQPHRSRRRLSATRR